MTVSANEVGVSLYWLGRVVVSSTAVPMSLLPRAGLGVGSAYFSIVGNVGIYGGGKVCAYQCYSNASPSESMPDPSPVCVAGTRVVTAAAPVCRLCFWLCSQCGALRILRTILGMTNVGLTT
jgi:hypothetical protein